MRIRSRTARRDDAFDRRFDSVVAPVLLGAGFTETQPYVFTRPDSTGRDIAYFDVEGKSFIVHLGYRPRYMEEIDRLFEHLLLPKEPDVGACPYLTPKCMTHRPKQYPCKLAAQRDRSFDMVVQGLTTHALDGLASLRDPVCFADSVPPTCLMHVGRANEVASRLDRARVAYEEQIRRELACWATSTFSEFVEFEGARAFVYLCLKLRHELDKCERVMAALKFRPNVEPLPV